MSAHNYTDSELPPVVTFDRRRAPDRRVGWRGGRRDSDWLNRPPGMLEGATLRNLPWLTRLARRLPDLYR